MSKLQQEPRPAAFTARGNSMFPLIPDGTVLLFEPAGRLARGDVALVRAGDRLTAHRVIEIDARHVRLWGDWNRAPDAPVPRSCVAGRCVSMLRKGVPIGLDWPSMRLLGRVLAVLLPACKEILNQARREEG